MIVQPFGNQKRYRIFGLKYLLQRNCLGRLGMNGKILEKDLWKIWT